MAVSLHSNRVFRLKALAGLLVTSMALFLWPHGCLAQHVPAQNTQIQQAPSQHVPSQHKPSQHAPIQHRPIQPAPLQVQHVKNLSQSLVLGPSGQLAVDETIVVDFGKATPATFCRRIATLYKRSGRLCSQAIYVKGVTDESGYPLPYSTKEMQGVENIVIGDSRHPVAGVNATGVHVFRLNYDLINSVNFASGQPELFYSALGCEWSIPIDKATIAFSLAPNQTGLAGRAVGYVGNFGAKKRAVTKLSSGALNLAAVKLSPGQDLLVVLPLPPGSVAQSGWPDALTEIYQTSKLAVLLPAGTLAALVILWFFIGSDQHFGKPPVFTLGAPWQPPRELTPAEVGTIIDETCDDKDIVATIFDLASRGYLAIREMPYHGLMGYGSKDYEFSQPPQPVKGIMKAHEELIVNAIFTGRNKSYLSDMNGYFFDYMPVLRKQILTGLAKDKFFARDPQSDRDYFVTSGSCVLALGASLYAYSVFGADTYKIASYGIMISGIFIFLASGAMPKRTRKGVGAIEQCHKFEHFILHAKEEEIDAAYAHDPTIFYRLLPYTIVLGMAEFWAARFKHLIKESPPWYTSMEELQGASDGFNTEVLVAELMASMHAIAHVATTRPEHKSGGSQGHVSSRNLP